MNTKMAITICIVGLLVAAPLLYVSGGCLLYVRTVGMFYPDMKSKRQEGEFEPYVAFLEKFRRGENGFSLPVVCTPSAYRDELIMLGAADVTKTMGYERFETVSIDLFEVEYESGDKQVFVSPGSSSGKYRVCNGAYADCGMDSRDFPEKYELDQWDNLVVRIKGVAMTVGGDKEAFSFRQKWEYRERLSVRSFVEAMP
jgi:hypothetical protein